MNCFMPVLTISSATDITKLNRTECFLEICFVKPPFVPKSNIEKYMKLDDQNKITEYIPTRTQSDYVDASGK